MKGIINIALGAILTPSGGGVLFYFLKSSDDNRNLWLFALSIVLLGTGLVLLSLALRKPIAALTGIENTSIEDSSKKTGKGENLLERNNELMEQWSQVNDNKDKLKMLEVSANAQQQN